MLNPTIKVLSLAALLGVLPAGAAAAGENACSGIEVRAGTLLFADGFESGDASAWGSSPRFRATRILDLDIEVRFGADFSGDHVLHVKLLTPKGHHYQTLTAPVATGAARAGTQRRVEGYPRPLAVLFAQPAAGASTGETAVTQKLPVAGTAIVSNALYGEWTATASLDDETASCGATAGFFITP